LQVKSARPLESWVCWNVCSVANCEHWLLDFMVRTCIELEQPKEAWAFRRHFRDISMGEAEERILDAVAAKHGADETAKLVRPDFDKALQGGNPAAAARHLSLVSRYASDLADKGAMDLLKTLDLSGLDARYGIPQFLTSMTDVLVRIDRRNLLVALLRTNPPGSHWFRVLERLEPSEALFQQALRAGDAEGVTERVEHPRSGIRDDVSARPQLLGLGTANRGCVS
jgi:hypothetical protein